jgi:mannose-1-phosphate guanylyltransferase
MAARGSMLREAGETFLPDLVRRLRTIREFWSSEGQDPGFDAEQEALTLLETYHGLSRANFSRDVLQRCPSRAVVLPMADVEWSDWGKPERISETLARHPHIESVPREYLTAG